MYIEKVQIVSTAVVSPYYLYLRDDGIMFVRISSEKEESVELAKKVVEKIGEMVNYKKVPILYRHEEFALPGKENRDFWAMEDSCPYSLADAFIVKSTALKLIANFYLKFNKPQRPTKMFDNEDAAVKWLNLFID